MTTYIDGFNLYHAIDELRRPHLKWLNLMLLAQSLLRAGEEIAEVKYFSAYATWLREPYARHRAYTEALAAQGIKLHMAQFKEKPRKCRHCGTRWIGHEEKETDVQIAVHMVADALRNKADRLVLISADTDLVPPIKMIAALVPKCEVFVSAPPGRLSRSRSLGPKLEITAGRLAKCLLPAECPTPAGIIRRPPTYHPPTG